MKMKSGQAAQAFLSSRCETYGTNRPDLFLENQD